MTTDSLNALTEKWKRHCISQKLDLRSKLIDACAEHEGWEESSIALIDEAIMPIVRQHEAEIGIKTGINDTIPIPIEPGEINLLDPDMPSQELRLHMGEMTAQEERTARAAIRWANSVRHLGLIDKLEAAKESENNPFYESIRDGLDIAIAIVRQHEADHIVEVNKMVSSEIRALNDDGAVKTMLAACEGLEDLEDCMRAAYHALDAEEYLRAPEPSTLVNLLGLPSHNY